jgi:hypothetical protein
MRFVVVVAFILGSALLGSSAQAEPPRFDFNGHLSRVSGEPVSDVTQITFRLYDRADGGTLLHVERQAVKVQNGDFHAAYGAVTPVDEAKIRDYDNLWVSVQIGRTPEVATRTHLVHKIK